MVVRGFCCLSLLTFLLRTSWTVAERKYDDVLFSAATCEEYGLGDDFDVCGVLEFCLGTVNESSDEDYDVSGESKSYYEDYDTNENSISSVSTDGNSRNDGYDDPLQTETFASESERAKSKSMSSPNSTSSPALATYGYRTSSTSPCLRPGPVVRLERGRKHGLLLRGADSNNDNGVSSSSQAVPANLHFHGLHVKGYGNGDDARRTVSGTDNYLVYDLDLPLEQHHGGTHWYHSHVQIFEGINAWEQIKGGAFGPIVINDAHDADVGTNDPNVLTFLNDPNHEKIFFLDNTLSHNQQSYTANGIPPPNLETIHVVQNQWYRLRILLNNVSSYSANAVLSFGTACKAHAIAHDGIPRFNIPDPHPKESFGLTSASRLDVALICDSTDNNKNANVLVDGTVVAIFSIDASSPPSTATPFQTSTDGMNTPVPWRTTRLEYTRDLRQSDDDPGNYWTIHIDETNINDINSGLNEPLCDNSRRDFVVGQLQEWTITGADSHPLHLHVHPMQVVDGCGNGHEVGEYYDTIVSANSDLGSATTKGGGGLRKMWWNDDERRCVVRVKLVDIPGPVKIHCHILEHAERGASGWINVVTNGGGTSYSTDKPSCVGTCDEKGEARTKCSEL